MIFNFITKAKDLFFNNSASGLESTNVQSAIDELQNILLSTGINMDLLGDNIVPVKLSFKDLIKKTTLTFFANTTDSENFPTTYGSGVMIPQADSRYRYIIYVSKNNMYEGYVTVANNTVVWNRKANASELSNYLPLTGKASSATIADSATKATQDGNGNDIAGTYATKTTLTSAGIGANILQSNSVGGTLPFEDLVAKRVVTFFTNWYDTTHFPKKYGSGILIPTLDATDKIIYYQMKNDAWIGYLKLQSDQVTFSTITWNKISKDCSITLWNNTSIGTLSEQTISVDLTNIKAIEIQYIEVYYPDAGTYGLRKATTGRIQLDTSANEIIQLSRFYPRAGYLGGLRDIRVIRTSNQITICDGMTYNESFVESTDNTQCVPTKIIGYYE